jgi:hypothetical protein
MDGLTTTLTLSLAKELPLLFSLNSSFNFHIDFWLAPRIEMD